MPTTKDTPSTLVVLESFIGRLGKDERIFRKGDNIRPNDPAVKRWPRMFGPVLYASDVVGVNQEAPIEQATAAPGEKRGD